MGSFKMCSDIIESLYESLIGLTVETSGYVILLRILKKFIMIFLKIN